MKLIALTAVLVFIPGANPASAAIGITPSIAIVDTGGGGGGGVSGGYIDGTDAPFCGRGHSKC